MGMDLKNKKRNILGILIMTIIFGAFSIVSVMKMFDNQDQEKPLKKENYVLMLEKELNISLDSQDDFTNFSNVSYEMLVEPTKYKNYYKPCFEFVVEKDGVVIKNGLTKDFNSLGLKEGMKITRVNEDELSGKSYFEILELVYSKKENEVKKFTFTDGTIIEYTYKYYKDNAFYDEEENVLYVYNLDNVTAKFIYEAVEKHPNLTLDLSNSTVTTLDGLTNFISLFSKPEEILFKTPENITGQINRKISDLKIVVGSNNDQGVLFALTSINRINPNINIDNKNLNTISFFAEKVLESSYYTIYIKNVLVEAKNLNNSGNSGSVGF